MLAQAVVAAILTFPMIYFIAVIYSVYNQKEISDVE
jgi:cbb3-type cytochrome oxidase subunit 3